MPSLAKCLDQYKDQLSSREITDLKKSAKEFLDKGMDKREAEGTAVEKVLDGLDKEKKEIVDQIAKALGITEEMLVEKAKEAKPAEAKQPWDMTKEDAWNTLPISVFNKAAREADKEKFDWYEEHPTMDGKTRFNDLHKTIVKQALRSGDLTPARYAELHEKDYGPLEEFMPELGKEKPSFYPANKIPWPQDFPNVTVHTSINKLKTHPDYKAAKGGDEQAAARLAEALVNETKAKALVKKHPNAILLPVISLEKSGMNKLPLALAARIQELTGLPVSDNVIQSNYVDRTNKNSIDRLLTIPSFNGIVNPNREYILVDDGIGQGGTLSELRYHIETNGGKVVDTTSFAAGIFATKLAIKPETIKKIEDKHGRNETEKFIQEFGIAGALEALTEKQARAILSASSLDTLRNEAASRGYTPSSETTERQARLILPITKPTGIRKADIENFFDPIIEKLAVKPGVVVVHKQSELPEDVLVYAKKHGIERIVAVRVGETLYFVAENIDSINEAQKALFHELYGHYGPAKLFGTKFEPFLQQIYMSYGKKGLQDIADKWGFDLNTRDGRLGAASEKLALMAHTGEKPALLQKIYTWIKNWLRQVGFNKITLTDADLKDVISRRVKDYLERGKVITQVDARTMFAGKMEGEEVKPLYSAVTKAVESKFPDKLSAQSVLNFIRKQPNVKEEELQWLGLEQWLEGKDKVTKEELLAFVRENEVEVEEVMLGKGAQEREEIGKQIDELDLQLMSIDPRSSLSNKKLYDSLLLERNTARDQFNKLASPDTEYSPLQLGEGLGAEGYRELVMKLPSTKQMLTAAEKTEMTTLGLKGKLTRVEKARYDELNRIEMVGIDYSGAHFPGARPVNPVVHIRFNERTDANGKRTMFLEEVQSDLDLEIRRLEEGKAEGLLADTEIKRLEELKKLMPWGDKWYQLGLKRAIRWAVENGYEQIGWTTGEQQKGRYSLEKRVREVNARKIDEEYGRLHNRTPGNYDLDIVDIHGEHLDDSRFNNIPANKLSGVIGKDLAKKIINNEGKQVSDKWVQYSGEDLKIGGEWATHLYDEMIPNFLKKYTKQWGGEVGKTEIQTIPEIKEDTGYEIRDSKDPIFRWDVIDKNTGEIVDQLTADEKPEEYSYTKSAGIVETVHSLSIPAAMRESVVAKGQPMFMKKEGETADEWAERILASVGIEPSEKAVKDTVELNSEFQQNFADYQKAANPENPENVDPKRELNKNEVENYIRAHASAIGSTVSSLRPKNLPHASVFERLLASPEFYQHPVLKKLVDHALDRNSLFYDNMNSLNATDEPFQPYETVTDATKALAMKGISKKAFYLLGKKSNDYKLFREVIDQGDIENKDSEQYEKELRTGLPKYIEIALEKQGISPQIIQKYKQVGIPEDVIQTWKLHRASYDNALDMLIKPLEELQAKYEETEKKSPDFIKITDETGKEKILNLQESIAEIKRWKGSYAPRIREIGNWIVTGYKTLGVEKDKVFYRKKNRYTAKLLAANLRAKGFTVSEPTEQPPISERTYQMIKVMETAKFVEQAAKGMKTDDFESKAKFLEEIFETAADMFRARGFRSHAIHRQRGGPVTKGYIEDPNERFVRYIANVSAGMAKAETAKRMMTSFFGEYDAEGNRVGGIDQVTEHKAYDVGSRYIEEQLRNTERADRVIALVKSIATFKYLGLNPRSLAVNATAMAITVPSSLHQYAGEGKVGFATIAKETGKALQEYGRRMAGRDVKLSKEDERFLNKMENRHYADAQYARDASGTIRGTYGKTWSNAMAVSMYAFGKEEKLMRSATMLAGFRIAKKTGASYQEASERGQLASNRAHGIYSSATLPIYAQGKHGMAQFIKLNYTYLKFPHTYIQTLYDLGMRKKNIKAFVWQLALPIVLSGAAAIPYKDVWLFIIGSLLKALGDDRDPEKMVWDGVRESMGETAEMGGRLGLFGLAGVDLSGSLSIGVGVPRKIPEMFGVAGGVYNDLADAYRHIEAKQPGRAIEKTIPTGIANIFRAQREKITGATTTRGRRVFNDDGTPYVPTGAETFWRTAGFRSSKEALLANRRWEETREANRFKETHDAILEAIRANALNPEVEREQAIWDDIAEYNDVLLQTGKTRIPFLTQRSIETQLRNLGLYGTDPKEVVEFKGFMKQVRYADEHYQELKDRDPVAAEKFNQKTKNIRKLSNTFKSGAKLLAKKKARKKEIIEGNTYSPEQKQKYIEILNQYMVNIAKLRNDSFNKIMAQ